MPDDDNVTDVVSVLVQVPDPVPVPVVDVVGVGESEIDGELEAVKDMGGVTLGVGVSEDPNDGVTETVLDRVPVLEDVLEIEAVNVPEVDIVIDTVGERVAVKLTVSEALPDNDADIVAVAVLEGDRD